MHHLAFALITTFVFGLTLFAESRISQWISSEPYQANFLYGAQWDEKQPDPEEVTIVAFGDMMLGRYVRTLMERHGHDYPFEHVPALVDHMLAPENLPEDDISPATGAHYHPDFLFANLEGPISTNPYTNPGTAMMFNFRPDVTEMLTKYNFNLVSVANNHAFDMGEAGEQETRQFLTEAGIHHFGHSREIREENVWSTQVEDTTIAFVGFNHTLHDLLDFDAAAELIASLEEDHDFTIVSIHWGTEYKLHPNDRQVLQAHQLVDAGADAIIGHHPHVIQSNEVYNGAPIYYSLGNFIFDQYFQQNVQEGLGLTLTLKKSSNPDEPNTVHVRETIFDIIRSQPQIRD